MAQITPALPAGPGQPVAPLGVIDALGMGWRLMLSDFWGLWLPAFGQVSRATFAIDAYGMQSNSAGAGY